MENKEIKNDIIKDVVEQQEKDYYTKDEVEVLIAKSVNNALGDLIVKLNENVKPKQDEPKPKTIKELRF